jgi:hypothetical protein
MGQAQALGRGLSLNQVAQRLGVAQSTAFRWRHRFLACPKPACRHASLWALPRPMSPTSWSPARAKEACCAVLAGVAARHWLAARARSTPRADGARPGGSNGQPHPADEQGGECASGAQAVAATGHHLVHRWQRHSGQCRAGTGRAAPGSEREPGPAGERPLACAERQCLCQQAARLDAALQGRWQRNTSIRTWAGSGCWTDQAPRGCSPRWCWAWLSAGETIISIRKKSPI